MITTLSSLDLILAKNEFVKDYGITHHQTREALVVKPIYEDQSGNTHFEVTLHGKCLERDWEIEKIDLSRLSNNHFKVESRLLRRNDICDIVHRATGYGIVTKDISNIEKITGGWMVYIDPTSLRYSGSFKIKNR